MIEFCDGKYRAERDRHQWTLSEKYQGADKDGNEAVKWRRSFYPNLRQAVNAMLDMQAGKCEGLEHLHEMLGNAGNMVMEEIAEQRG